jgi:uncharacterized protein YqiB (DUF1249 family)
MKTMIAGSLTYPGRRSQEDSSAQQAARAQVTESCRYTTEMKPDQENTANHVLTTP